VVGDQQTILHLLPSGILHKGKTCIIVDDMVDTAGTLSEGANALKERGAAEVHACCSHAVLSGPAVERINDSAIETLVVTNSIPIGEKAKASDKIRVLSVSKLLAEAIHRAHTGSSVSSLFVYPGLWSVENTIT